MVKVQAAHSWEAALSSGVYSCPDNPDFNFVSGASILELHNRKSRESVKFNVLAVHRLGRIDEDAFAKLPTQFQGTARKYAAQVLGDARIIYPDEAHRFYFLQS